jgi:steroid 5-alpha reductase family enzyme
VREVLSLPYVALCGLALCAVLAALTWVASLARSDVSLVDRMWSVFIAGACVVYFGLLSISGGRGPWMLALVLVWALRLCIYITWRNWGHGEDRRYKEIRARNQPHFALKSLYLVFALQAMLAWIVSAPIFVGLVVDGPLNWLDGLGIAIAALGIGFEAVGDWQMSRFKADPANRGRVMDRGVWRYTRHPNYFGETCVWWGLWLMALAGAGLGGAWSVISPVLMTILLLKVSGVALLEKNIGERRPQYREYIERTSAFIPRLPRKKATQ